MLLLIRDESMKISGKKLEGFLLPAIVGGFLAVILLTYMNFIDFTYAQAHFIELLMYIGLFELVYLSGVAVWRYTSKFEATRTGRVMRDYATRTANHMDDTISNFTDYIPNLKQFNGLLDSFTNSFSEKVNSVIQGLETRTSDYLKHRLSVLDTKTNQLNESFELVETIPGIITQAANSIEKVFKDYIEQSLSKVVNESIHYQQGMSNLENVITELESGFTNTKLQLKETHTVLLGREEHINDLEGQLIDYNKVVKTKDAVIQEREAEVSRLKNEIIDSIEQLRHERSEEKEVKEKIEQLPFETEIILNYATQFGIVNDLQVVKLFETNSQLSPKLIKNTLEIQESTVYNILNRLMEHGTIEKQGRGEYTLTERGLEFLEYLKVKAL